MSRRTCIWDTELCDELQGHNTRSGSTIYVPSQCAGAAVIFTPIPFSLLRAVRASGVCGCRWMSKRSS